MKSLTLSQSFHPKNSSQSTWFHWMKNSGLQEGGTSQIKNRMAPWPTVSAIRWTVLKSAQSKEALMRWTTLRDIIKFTRLNRSSGRTCSQENPRSIVAHRRTPLALCLPWPVASECKISKSSKENDQMRSDSSPRSYHARKTSCNEWSSTIRIFWSDSTRRR